MIDPVMQPMARIIICDDEPHITRAVEVKLRKAGHEVVIGHNGAEALAAARSRRPDLIVTDCQMPVMTGLELCAAVLTDQNLSGTPVIMLTAKGLEISEEDLRTHLGVRKLVFKPFSPRDLLQLVNDCTATPTAA